MSHEVLAQRRQLFISFQIKMKYEKDIFQSVKRAGRKKNPSSPNRSGTYDVLVTRLTTPDALPLSYRRLVGAKATKLRSCDKHPTYCYDWNVNMCLRAIIEMWRWILNLVKKWERCFSVSETGGLEMRKILLLPTGVEPK